MRISDWSSDVCSSDLDLQREFGPFVVCQFAQPRHRRVLVSRFEVAQEFARQLGEQRRAAVVVAVERVHQRLPALVAVDTPQHRRSEEHTSELQSLMRISYAVFCLKKKNNNLTNTLLRSPNHLHYYIPQRHE